MTSLTSPENDYRSLLPVGEEADVDVTVVIPVYNRVSLLARTVAALAAQDHPPDRFEVVVADDGSEEDVQAALAPLRGRLDLTVVRREHDGYGAGQARNLGASAARGEVLVFVDADCVPDRSLVRRHARWHRLADNLVIIGSRHPLDTSALAVDDLADGHVELPREPGDVGPSDWRRLLYRRTASLRRGDEAFRSLVSSNFSVRKDTFVAAGGFDASFTRWGGEDTELGWRLFHRGCFFVPDDDAVVFHQIQEDAGGEGWRGVARHHNDGIIRAKIPHRFYRKDRSLFIHEVPKVSIVVAPVTGERAYEVFADLLRQSHTDWSATFVGRGIALTSFGEEAHADPRVDVQVLDDDATDAQVSAAIRAAADAATGEYVAFLHGSASMDHRLLGRVVRRLDGRPRVASASVGYRLPGTGRASLMRRDGDVRAVDRAWRPEGLPVFGVLRAREWNKLRRDDGGVTPWETLSNTPRGHEHLTDALVGVPGVEPAEGAVPPVFRNARARVVDAVRSRQPRRVAAATVEYARERVGRPRANAVQVSPGVARLDRSEEGPRGDDAPTSIPVRYVGWTGHENLGDEVLFDAIQGLLPWADLQTSGAPRSMLMLGGGTLINRGYLAQLDRMDSPRIERVVFGTGVANPEYWGTPREDPDAWVEFLSTCAYVGVRGPISERLLRNWGYRGKLEVVGDPALAIQPTAGVTTVDGRVVVTIARARGELWGGSDERVVEAVASMIRGLVAEGRDVHLLSFFPGDDGLGLEAMRRAGVADLPYHFGYRDTPGALALLTSASIVVSERLHGVVLAAACGTPFVGLEYRPKVRDFAQSVNAQRWVLRTDELENDALTRRVHELDAELDQVRSDLEAHVNDYRQRLRRAADLIREIAP